MQVSWQICDGRRAGEKLSILQCQPPLLKQGVSRGGGAMGRRAGIDGAVPHWEGGADG